MKVPSFYLNSGLVSKQYGEDSILGQNKKINLKDMKSYVL